MAYRRLAARAGAWVLLYRLLIDDEAVKMMSH
ncbi:hypothetical protein BOTU111921_25975 [Bordetella tumbae]